MPFGQIEALAHDGLSLALEQQQGAAPCFVWLGGFKSDMSGAKAQALATWARERGQAFVRFDYSGHGQSGGGFTDGSISRWLGDALAVIDQRTAGPLVLVGSSMGGWLALLAARARAARVKGLLLIAPAADFTERLLWPRLSPAQQQRIMETGRLEQPSAYAPEPTIFTRTLIEDGRKHLIMDRPIALPCPVRILTGGADADVPAAHVQELAGLIEGGPVRLRLIADGDHRLSRPEDIAALLEEAGQLAS